MKARGIVAVLAAMVLLGALALPGSSAAAVKPASRHTPRSVVEEFSLQGTHGFTVTASVRDRRRLGLTATAFHGLFSIDEAIYRLPVRRPHGSADINARIGRLGHIDVHFVPESIEEEAPPRSLGCHGGKITVEDGHFVGLIAFTGERGFTRVRAHQATGSITVRRPSPAISLPKSTPKVRVKAAKPKNGKQKGPRTWR